MPASPIRKLVPLANKAKENGIDVLHLNIGQPDIASPPQALDALKHIDRSILEYSPSEGLLSLRLKLVEYYARFFIDVHPDDIIITTGGSEAVFFSFLACLDPGDEILVPEPAYANYMAFAISAGVIIKPIPASIDNGFALPPIDAFEQAITPRTRAILICNPNNPTGYLYTSDEMERIRHLVQRFDLFLFADEVYREFCYSPYPYFSVLRLRDIDNNVVLVDSFSKRYSLCGIRIGAVITRNPILRQNLLKWCQARLSPPLIGQIVAQAAIDTSQTYLNQVYNEYLKRRNCLLRAINDIPGCFAPVPMGAFYTLARIPVRDADHFCAWCLDSFSYEGQTLFLAPGSGFYSSPELGHDQVRLAFVLDAERLARAAHLLFQALKRYKEYEP
jgi:aspartate aminotransferase